MTDNQVHQAYELWYKKNEREDSEAKDGVGGNFPSNVSIEQAHICAPPF
jgi:hypothetical protein